MLVLWLFISAMSVAIDLSCCVPLSTSQSSESILLTFSGVNVVQWQRENKSDALKSVLANLTTNYCNSYPLKCGLTSLSSTFNSSNVKFQDNYPINSDNNLEIVIFIELPKTNNETNKTLPRTSLLTIVNDNTEKLSSFIGVALKIKNEQTSENNKMPNNKLNYIMIPISFLLLIIIAALAWVLNRKRKKQKKQEEQMMLRLHVKKSETVPEITEQRPTTGSTLIYESPQSSLTNDEFGHVHESKTALHEAPESNPGVQRKKPRHRRPKKAAGKSPVNDDNDNALSSGVIGSVSDVPDKATKKSRWRIVDHLSKQEHDGTSSEEREISKESISEGKGEEQVNMGYQGENIRELSG